MLFAGIGLVNVIVQGGLVGRLAKRIGEPMIISRAPILLCVGFLGLSILPRIESDRMALACLLLSGAVVATGSGLQNPSLQSLISRQASAGVQGGTLGLAQGLSSLARTMCPPIAGLLYDSRPALPYWVGAALYLGAFVIAVWMRPAQERSLAEPGEHHMTKVTE
jgi:DHA1 family tetracycline resistance protein-like MFS transporter